MTPLWFDSTYYMQAKLAQMQVSDPAGNWTMDKLWAAFIAAGYTHPYDHYVAFGISEGLNPNAVYDENEYLAAKTAQLGVGWALAKTKQAIADAGMTAAEHYDRYGWLEGVNPSADFDAATYIRVKGLQCGLSETEVTQAFVQCALNPVEHYMLYAAKEGITQETWETWLHPEPEKPWDVSVDYKFDETVTKHSETDTATSQEGDTVTHIETTVSHSETDSTETTVIVITGVDSTETLGEAFDMIGSVGK